MTLIETEITFLHLFPLSLTVYWAYVLHFLLREVGGVAAHERLTGLARL